MTFDERTEKMLRIIGTDTPIYWREYGSVKPVFKASAFDVMLALAKINSKYLSDGIARLEDFFSCVGGNRYFTTMNIESGWAFYCADEWGEYVIVDIDAQLSEDMYKGEIVMDYCFDPAPCDGVDLCYKDFA